jgi:hypothetical protein
MAGGGGEASRAEPGGSGVLECHTMMGRKGKASLGPGKRGRILSWEHCLGTGGWDLEMTGH